MGKKQNMNWVLDDIKELSILLNGLMVYVFFKTPYLLDIPKVFTVKYDVWDLHENIPPKEKKLKR